MRKEGRRGEGGCNPHRFSASGLLEGLGATGGGPGRGPGVCHGEVSSGQGPRFSLVAAAGTETMRVCGGNDFRYSWDPPPPCSPGSGCCLRLLPSDMAIPAQVLQSLALGDPDGYRALLGSHFFTYSLISEPSTSTLHWGALQLGPPDWALRLLLVLALSIAATCGLPLL